MLMTWLYFRIAVLNLKIGILNWTTGCSAGCGFVYMLRRFNRFIMESPGLGLWLPERVDVLSPVKLFLLPENSGLQRSTGELEN